MKVDKGYVEAEIAADVDLKKEIERLKKEKKAVVLAHYYTVAAVQEVADFIGDSLALAQVAEGLDAEIVVMCGVHFMGETVKILCPDKKVLVPDLNAGCSLADSCPAEELEKFIAEHPGHMVVSYVNTSAAVKALTDVVVTSGNAMKIVNALPKDAKIIFGPDRNLGNYINSQTGREMVLWDGACHVHEKFSLEKLLELKKIYPQAKVLVHPECPAPVRLVADKVGSTAVLLKWAEESDHRDCLLYKNDAADE
ncbi:MAG: quinolinate synthase NadA [Duncaniella sp.]|nr:quinolinate synthase NadA [Duncaniella sp.]